MLYICASIGFFIFALRSILLWTYIWQTNGYEMGRLFNNLKEFSNGKIFLQSLPYLIFFLLILLYGVVIFNDTFAFSYQLIVTVVILCSVIIFLQEVFATKFKKPIFSLKALLISLLTTFIISLLYMVPLVDAYLWFILLFFMIPVLVSLFVALLSFPSELYEDYVLQKAKEQLEINPIPFSIAFVGDQKEFVAKVLYSFSSRLNIVKPKAKGFLPVVKEIKNGNASKSDVFIFEIPSSKEEMQKLLFLLRPSIIVATYMQEENDIYKTLFHFAAKDFVAITPKKNSLLIRSLRERHKKVLIYGWQKSSKKGSNAIYGYDLKRKNKNILFTIHLQKETFHVNMPFIDEEYLQYLLPAIYLARKLGISFTRIQKVLQLTYEES